MQLDVVVNLYRNSKYWHLHQEPLLCLKSWIHPINTWISTLASESLRVISLSRSLVHWIREMYCRLSSSSSILITSAPSCRLKRLLIPWISPASISSRLLRYCFNLLSYICKIQAIHYCILHYSQSLKNRHFFNSKQIIQQKYNV